MIAPIDEATSQFLEVAADDLELYLPQNGRVEGMTVTRASGGIGLLARIRISARVLELDGTGDSLVTAYADLRRRLPEARLAAAFRDLVEP